MLLLSEVFSCRGVASEGQRVDWVLRPLLMVNITVAVFPVGELLLVAGGSKDGLFLVVVRAKSLGPGLDLDTLEVGLGSCLHVHSVGVNDLGFFFEVESLGLGNLTGFIIAKVFLVFCGHRFWEWVTHEVARHASPTPTSVALST